MVGKIGKRVGYLVALVLLVSLGVLVLFDRLPGNAAELTLGPLATPEQVASYETELGLDRPLHERYVTWLGDLVTLDLGRSPLSGQEVRESLIDRLPATLEIGFGAIALALMGAVPLAVYAASRPGGLVDRATSFLSSAVASTPSFLIALALVYLLALQTDLLPIQGWVPLSENLGENLRTALMPALALAGYLFAVFARVLRNDMVATLQEDFVLAARARGLSRSRVLFRHALRPSLVSLVTVVGLTVGSLVGGTVLIESIFNVPGIGQLTFTAIQGRDHVTVRAVVVMIAIFYAATTTAVDLVYLWIDPRSRAHR
jgi:peptide/nickel transport system permease protein